MVYICFSYNTFIYVSKMQSVRSRDLRTNWALRIKTTFNDIISNAVAMRCASLKRKLLIYSAINTWRLHSVFREKKPSGRCRYGNSILWLAKYIYAQEEGRYTQAINTRVHTCCLTQPLWTGSSLYRRAGNRGQNVPWNDVSLNIPFIRATAPRQSHDIEWYRTPLLGDLKDATRVLGFQIIAPVSNDLITVIMDF